MGNEDAESQPTNIRRSLAACTGDGATYSFMVGSGETYFAAFVLALGASDVAGGLVSSVPLLAGAILQLGAPSLARRVGSSRRWVSICAAIQFLSFVPLVLGAALGHIPLLIVFASISLYWAAALGAGPTWSTWVATTFPPRLRARYFALRNRLCQLVQLSGIIGAGLVLAYFERRGTPDLHASLPTDAPNVVDAASRHDLLLPGFAIIMAIAAVARLSSTLFLRAQEDAPIVAQQHERVGVLALLGRLAKGRDLRLINYLIVAQFTVQVSAPYFNPFMLRSLELSKGQYLLMIATLFASKSLFLPMHGHFARRFGARRLLTVAGFGIVLLSAAWAISPSLWYLVPLQALNGCVWGAWELATFLLMLETIPDRERTGVLTVFNLLNCVAMVLGSLVGAFLLKALGSGREAYLALFLISSMFRLAALPALLAIGRERRPPSRALTVAAEEAAGRSAPGSQGRAALPSFTGPGMPAPSASRRKQKDAPRRGAHLWRRWRRGDR